MVKKITSRMKQIAEIILSEPNITIKEVSDTLKISLRQVRYDVSCINEYFKDLSHPVLETDNKGLFIVNNVEKLKIIKKSKKNNFKFSQEQRLHLLLVICAFNIKKMNLSQLSKEMNISRMTIKNDLELVKESLKQYHLELNYNNIFYLTGNAKNQYEFQRDVLYLIEYSLYKEEFEKCEILMHKYIMETFNNITIREIFPILHQFFETNNQIITDSLIYWFACTILLNIWYDKNNIPLLVQNKNIHLQSYANFQSFFDEIEILFDVKMSLESQQQIINHYNLMCHDQRDNQTINLKIIKFIYGLMHFIHQNYSQYFIEDPIFFNSLYYHLEKSYRLNNIKLEIPYFEEYYPSLDSKLSSLITQYCQENMIHDIYIDKQDINFIKLYFSNLFYRKKVHVKKIILICGAPKNLKEHLLSQLETFFYLKVVKVMSKYEIPFFDEWDHIDAILFTEKIPSYFKKNIPTEFININMSFEDYFKLYQLNIIPHKNLIDFKKLYNDLSFLNKENQIHAFQVLIQYLLGKPSLQSIPFFNKHHIILCHDFEKTDCETIEINQHFHLAIKNTQSEQIKVYLDENSRTVTFIIESYDPARIIQLLLGYSKLEFLEFWKLDDLHQIITFIQNFLKK
ncbi:helix-turn-helix domain-containing protein [Thomasclavelia cocleata]|uniref:helix-turn-helix domain-containing protein n=1 Tax=Thomasclavelia cocleata TaxID=69824 RepID=UPI00258B81A2|nr:helix-turn-helix domain-containing protein [Thomasclavelia cocleata]